MQPAAVHQGVIVADDSIIIRDNVRAALGEPWRVFLAADGIEAVEYARRVTAELVLLDFHMPRLDGVEACAVIRNLPNYASVPIVLLTAYDSVDLRRRAAQAGATAVFAKPFSATALRAGVLPLVALGRDAAQARKPSGGPDASLSPIAQTNDDLAAGRDVLAVYRKVEAAASPQRYGSFAEVMAARRMKSRR
ncbi:MAG TPA: response regulator [Acetobacteraceae bacterium]|nr:response regulator [Acetobacteraceae bacterium]